MSASSAPRSALAALLVLSAAIGGLVLESRTPPAPLPATASPRLFSAARAWRHVQAIAARPHPIGTAAHDSTRDYVMTELRTLGLLPEIHEATGVRWRSAARVQNVIARVPGTSRTGHAVLVMAHYDGVPTGPAAGDDAAGVAAVLELLRALRTSPPLRNDVIVLLSDGEEMGLLGAEAFVATHPWVKDVRMILNVEARGTTGRSMMFETGRSNLDVVRALRSVPDVSASSAMVTVYRNLPNDTDLSVFAPLGLPALNFAFIGGVERYHTPYDDVAHLDPRSLQHHGQQLLALVQRFGREPLPRPKTGDAVFFSLPAVGIVMYPVVLALPLALLVAAITLAGGVNASRGEATRWRAGAVGALGVLVSLVLAVPLAGWMAGAISRLHVVQQWDGSPGTSGIYAAALALLSLTITAAVWTVLRRWYGERSLWFGSLVLWSTLAAVSAATQPGVSYLLAWPLAGAAVLAWSLTYDTRVSEINGWGGALLALAVLVPITALASGYALPLDWLGAQAGAVLVTLSAWLLAPVLDTLLSAKRARGVALLGGATLAAGAYGMASVRRSDASPTHANIAYAVDADSGGAWLASSAGADAPSGSWGAALMGAAAERMSDSAARVRGATLAALARGEAWSGAARAMPRLPLTGATVDSMRWTAAGDTLRLTFRVMAPADVPAVAIRLIGATVRVARVEGRSIPIRPSDASAQFAITYFAPASTGVRFELDVARPTAPTPAPMLDVMAVRYGVPMAALGLPPRPPFVVPANRGDQTLVVRRVAVPAP